MNALDIDQLEFEIRIATYEALEQAKSFCGIEFEIEEVSLDLRGQSAGQVRYPPSTRKVSSPRVRFNPRLFVENKTAFLKEVVPHEVAHVVAYQLYGFNIKPHGPEWQGVMREVFGLEPSTTHKFDTPKSNRKTYTYHCACPGITHEIGSIRHNRVKKNQARYLCRSCGEALAEA